MPVHGGDKVRRNFKRTIGRISGATTEQAVTRIMIEGLANAAVLTPVDTNNLLNSQFRVISKVADGYKGTAGYTANYAAFVHDPRIKQNFKKAAAEKEFLRKGFERDGAARIRQILQEEYKV